MASSFTQPTQKEVKHLLKKWSRYPNTPNAQIFLKRLKNGESVAAVSSELAETLELSPQADLHSIVEKIRDIISQRKSQMTNSSPFSARNISLRAQKKFFGQFASKRVAKFFLDEESSELIENVYKLIRFYTDSKIAAHRFIKAIIKLNMKLLLLHFNSSLTPEEEQNVGLLHESLHNVVETFLSFFKTKKTQATNKVETFSEELSGCETILIAIVTPHLSAKSVGEIRFVVELLMDYNFIKAITSKEGEVVELVTPIRESIQDMFDRGYI